MPLLTLVLYWSLHWVPLSHHFFRIGVKESSIHLSAPFHVNTTKTYTKFCSHKKALRIADKGGSHLQIKILP